MNNISSDTIRSPAGIDEECAVFAIDDTSIPFVMHGIAQSDHQYTMSFYARSDISGSITIGEYTMETGNEWTRYVVTFIADSVDVPVYFDSPGTYYMYHTQLEIGCKDTDFALSPVDVETTVKQHTAEISVMQDNITANVTALQEVDGRLTTAEAQIELHADKIGLMVKEEDITGDYLIGKINLSSTAATIDAKYINLTGYVTMSNLATAGETAIDGANITTGLVSADRIDVNDLFSRSVTATNLYITGNSTFDGVLNGATGSFSGTIDATSIKAKNSYSIYVPDIGEKTVVSAYSWNFSGSVYEYNVLFGIPDTTGTISTSSGQADTKLIGLNADLISVGGQVDIEEGGLLVRFGGIECWESISCDSLNGKIELYGTNTISSTSNDTVQNWYPYYNSFHWYNTNGLLYDQPSNYGFLVNYGIGVDVVQLWLGACGAGLWYRGGNSAGWNGDGHTTGAWRKVISGSVDSKFDLSGQVIYNPDGCVLSNGNAAGIYGTENVFRTNLANDAKMDLGGSSARWKKVYAASSSISTSDERDKDIIGGFDERHKNLFMKLKPIIFRWKDGGIDTDIHFGLGAQTTEKSALECNITRSEIAAIEYDVWDEINPNDGRTDRYGMAYDEIHMLTIPVVQEHELRLNNHDTLISSVQNREEELQFQLMEAFNRISQQDEKIAMQAAEIEQLRGMIESVA